MAFEVLTYGDPAADTLLIQMVDDHDLEVIEKETAHIKELTGGQNFCLKAVRVNSWNTDLSPWPAPAVFGDEDFGEGASRTLEILLREIIPEILSENEKIYLGGYSLAGLFALWAGYQTDFFEGIAAASPSIWFPGFTDYMRANTLQAGAVYLSLGDREERTKNPFMSQVGNAIRDGYAVLRNAGINCTLEWNKGNHFKNPDLRTAKAFAWLMTQTGE
ncbi:MAG: esterase [Lachnospiraceae bacterium]|nr:esterase [Lachnospiraceae bacterium]